jgi:hypothetical protein
MLAFQGLFSQRVWPSVLVLVIGGILAPGKRTVSAILQVMGRDQDRYFQTYHRVLNRAKWSSLAASRILLGQLLRILVPTGPVVLGIDDTIERRKGKQIKAKGIYRDAVRSSKSQVVTVSGLRWLSLMVLVPIPWAKRIWALPFLTVLAPSERYHQTQGKRHKKLSDWARQMVKQVRQWLPQRPIVLVSDSSFAVLELLNAFRHLDSVTAVTRLRLDAALYQPAPDYQPGQKGRPPLKGDRLPSLQTRLTDPDTAWQSLEIQQWYGGQSRTLEVASETAVWYCPGKPPVPIRWVLVRDPLHQLEPQAFLCTDLNATPAQIIEWFCQRWSVEVTFEEVRAHMGVETQRQWSDLAILRTTPALFGLFSLVVLFAHQLQTQESFQLRSTAWYQKSLPTFADALAQVRQYLWGARIVDMSGAQTDMIKVPKALIDAWSDLLCYAA